MFHTSPCGKVVLLLCWNKMSKRKRKTYCYETFFFPHLEKLFITYYRGIPQSFIKVSRQFCRFHQFIKFDWLFNSILIIIFTITSFHVVLNTCDSFKWLRLTWMNDERAYTYDELNFVLNRGVQDTICSLFCLILYCTPTDLFSIEFRN